MASNKPSLYRYQFVSETPLSVYPYMQIELYDKLQNESVYKSAWEIICNESLLTQLDRQDLVMLCAAAVAERVKHDLLLRDNLPGFATSVLD